MSCMKKRACVQRRTRRPRRDRWQLRGICCDCSRRTASLSSSTHACSSCRCHYVPRTDLLLSLHFNDSLHRCPVLGLGLRRRPCLSLRWTPCLWTTIVIQNNLQFVAASNLEAATFQVSYQMKILTTTAFSVVLLRRKLSPLKWLALFFLAIGVGLVQIQCNVAKNSSDGLTADVHTMVPFKGFLAVAAACFTSGLAGVYFEMVLKNSTADLWVRNVQLSLFSLLPRPCSHSHGSVTFSRCSCAQCPLAYAPVCKLHSMGLGDRHHPGPRGTYHSPCDKTRRQHHEGICHFSVDCDIVSRLCRALPFPYHGFIYRRLERCPYCYLALLPTRLQTTYLLHSPFQVPSRSPYFECAYASQPDAHAPVA